MYSLHAPGVTPLLGLLCVLTFWVRGHRDHGVEEEEDERLMRPSAPATLFDFLTTKIPAKKEVRPAASESARGTSNRGTLRVHGNAAVIMLFGKW